MHIVLTGEKSAGKTTVVKGLVFALQELGHKPFGFFTEKYPRGLKLQNVQGGAPLVLARIEPLNAHHCCYTPVGRYYFVNETVRFGLHMLRWPGDLLVIDEFGLWEAQGGGFARAIDIINSSQVRHSLAVVRKDILPRIIERYKREPMIIEVSPANRGVLVKAIAQRFDALLSTQDLEEHLSQ